MAAITPRTLVMFIAPAFVVAVSYCWLKKRIEDRRQAKKQKESREKLVEKNSGSIANSVHVVASSEQTDSAATECVELTNEPLPAAECTESAFSREQRQGVESDFVEVEPSPEIECSLSERELAGNNHLAQNITDVQVEEEKVVVAHHSEISISSQLPSLDSEQLPSTLLSEDGVDASLTMHDKSKSSEFQPVPSPVTNDFVDKEQQQALSKDVEVELEPEDQLKSSIKDIETIDCSGDKNNSSWKHSVLVAALDTIQKDSSDDNKSQWQDLEKTLAEGDSTCVDTVLSSLNKLDETLQEISLTSKEEPKESSSQTILAVEVTVPTITDKSDGESKEKNDTDAAVMLVQNNVTLQNQTESADTSRYTLATDSDINTSAYGTANHSPSEEMLESPAASNFSDIHSEGSTDSGKSAGDALMPGLERRAEVPMQETKVYEFELPQELCGRLIGRQGQTITFIKNTSRANIYVKRHPYNTQLKLCVVSGPPSSIEKALSLIRKKFPISKFSGISLAAINGQEKFPDLSGQGIPVPDTLQLHLPEGIMCDVILSSLINGGHFFLQQPTHPTYPSLCQLDQNMLTCYMQMASPELPRPVDVGVICAAPMMEGWYRALVALVYEESDECDIKFVDYGGYSRVPISSLRQIRSDFMTLPFQASECYLGNVIPIDEEAGWTMEAYTVFEEIAQGQILQAQVVAYAEDGIPYVHLYRIQGATTTFINRELVTRGVALWIEHEG